ncbi:MAG: phage protein [Paucimonas sp.]|jgi:hypothetical protein|nr:phage protein [Paucimonas sp.]
MMTAEGRFLSLLPVCPSWLDPELAHIEAVAGIEARERGLQGAWSHPAIYWAAIRVGAFDLKRMTYPEIRIRWEVALRETFCADEIPAVPEAAQLSEVRECEDAVRNDVSEAAWRALRELRELTGISARRKMPGGNVSKNAE